MTPQEIFLCVPRIIFYFSLSLLDAHTLGYAVDMGCIFVIGLLFWLKVGEALVAIVKKLFGFSGRGGQ